MVRSPDVARFLAVARFAVVGASSDREKYGNKVLRCYAQHGLPVVGVNPRLTEVEGQPCHASLKDVPGPPRAVSVVAPPAAAAGIVADAAEEPAALEAARSHGIEVIAGGPCLLVALGFRDV
jgi:uncharacterized protein